MFGKKYINQCTGLLISSQLQCLQLLNLVEDSQNKKLSAIKFLTDFSSLQKCVCISATSWFDFQQIIDRRINKRTFQKTTKIQETYILDMFFFVAFLTIFKILGFAKCCFGQRSCVNLDRYYGYLEVG